MLQQTFVSLAGSYSLDTEFIRNLWREIEEHYSAAGRFYHNLSHLNNVLYRLTEVRDRIDDWETVLFSLYYHDVIYDTQNSDNEAQSAVMAIDRLQQLAFPYERIARCERHILATKGHSVNEDGDTNLFTDADLSILGSDWKDYHTYATQIRKEYAVFPDQVYMPGRRKVLEHFLAMPRIFKTEAFSERFEANARQNLERELSFF